MAARLVRNIQAIPLDSTSTHFVLQEVESSVLNVFNVPSIHPRVREKEEQTSCLGYSFPCQHLAAESGRLNQAD